MFDQLKLLGFWSNPRADWQGAKPQKDIPMEDAKSYPWFATTAVFSLHVSQALLGLPLVDQAVGGLDLVLQEFHSCTGILNTVVLGWYIQTNLERLWSQDSYQQSPSMIYTWVCPSRVVPTNHPILTIIRRETIAITGGYGQTHLIHRESGRVKHSSWEIPMVSLVDT